MQFMILYMYFAFNAHGQFHFLLCKEGLAFAMHHRCSPS